MAEPEDHTLRLLREFREESREFRGEVRNFQVRTDGMLNKMSADMSDVKDKVDTLTRAVAGEIVQSRYPTAGVDDRIAEIE